MVMSTNNNFSIFVDPQVQDEVEFGSFHFNLLCSHLRHCFEFHKNNSPIP
eukprot:JP438585.1.p2 GENE.JP438585.1~~JP438585.1.p2  ORF type:complete len:50 (+),score=4.55 JP438585.1:166-315(+)